MGSPRWKLNVADLLSAVRHVVFPVAGGAAIDALKTLEGGAFDFTVAKAAFVASAIAGAGRLLQKLVQDNSNVPNG